jgi:hypothetical protein
MKVVEPEAKSLVVDVGKALGTPDMNDIEAIYTYKGTQAIQTLIVGRDITGVGAFV